MNYYNTFIAAAPDTRATVATAPPERGGAPTVATLEYELISSRPYELTQEEVQFGWGLHFDAEGKVALVPLGSPEYEHLSADPAIEQTRAMRSRRG